MSQIKVNLDPQTQRLVERRAKAEGLSTDEWIGQVIQRRVQDKHLPSEIWREDWLALAGAFPDFPFRD